MAECCPHDMIQAGVSDEPTILDYLNEDCWRVILDYVPIRDIILSERVCRRWQQLVLMYLRGQRINIEMDGINLRNIDSPSNVRTVTLWLNGPMSLMGLPGMSTSFRAWLPKVEPAVVASWCSSKRMFKGIRAHCPNLESLTLVGINQTLSVKQNENVNQVRQLSFVQCMFSDNCINNFTRNNPVLEELGVYGNSYSHGLYLAKIKTRCLKTLIFSECTGLISNFLISAVNELKGLTKMILHKVPRGIYDKVHLLLNNMPFLEHFAIHTPFHGPTQILNEKNLEYIDSVCRLANLEHLGLAYDVSNEDIDAVTRHCRKLRNLEVIHSCGVTGRGLAAARRNAGARLRLLDVTECDVRDDDVVAVVRDCPKLVSLNLQLCRLLSDSLVPRIATARRATGSQELLRVHVGHTYMWRDIDQHKDTYKDHLILDY